MITETIKEINTPKFSVVFEVVDFCEGSPWFNDLYTRSDKHIAGTTIKPYNGEGNYIGQTTPSELAKQYAKEGRENPSAEAYASLQKELQHYIDASDCSIRCTILKCGIELASCYGVSFDFSYVYYDSHEDCAKQIIKDYPLSKLLKETISEARSTLQKLND